MHNLLRALLPHLHLPLMPMAAYLLALGMSTLLSDHLRAFTEHERSPSLSCATEVWTPAARDFDVLNQQGILGAYASNPISGVDASLLDSPTDDIDTLLPTTLPLHLVATSVFEQAEWSLATIEDVQDQVAGVYSVRACPMAAADTSARFVEPMAPCRQLLDKATIVRIERSLVVLFNKEAAAGRSSSLACAHFLSEPALR